MKRSTMIANFSSKLEDVWNMVTDNTAYAWRSDLRKIVISDDEKSFTETTKDGFETVFTITLKRPYERYAFEKYERSLGWHFFKRRQWYKNRIYIRSGNDKSYYESFCKVLSKKAAGNLCC